MIERAPARQTPRRSNPRLGAAPSAARVAPGDPGRGPRWTRSEVQPSGPLREPTGALGASMGDLGCPQPVMPANG